MRARTQEHAYISGRNIKPLADFDVTQYQGLSKLGINISPRNVQDMMQYAYAMDSLQPTVTTASAGTPVQFLQEWMPGFVYVITAARKIDELIGIQIIGSWEDEQVVQGVLERTGSGLPYKDYSNVPLASWNTNFVYRTVVRFEEGLRVGRLEAAQAARQRVDSSGMKREAAAIELEILRNQVGFYGFNDGDNLTYGFLNDPNLPNYIPVEDGVSGEPEWSTKTFLEITKDIRTAVVELRTNSQDQIDPESVDLTLAVATNSVDWLTTTSDFGISVRDWMRQAYPKMRVVSAPQLNAASSGDNVFYLYADRIQDESTDGGRVWVQPVPTKYMVLGVAQLAKGYEEDYSNATAGAMVKRPWAVVRFSGI